MSNYSSKVCEFAPNGLQAWEVADASEPSRFG